jgi:phospholipid/cholesterol/gamma-HCH transport system ATP-binding protein
VVKPVVELREVSVRWGARTVLDDVALSLEPGERLVVVGPSGAGKSTILRLMAGLLIPSSGELCIHGVPQTYLRLDQRHAPDVRLVFQNPALLASLTVRQNVGFLLDRFSHLSEPEIRQRVGAALDAVGLAGTEDLYPGEPGQLCPCRDRRSQPAPGPGAPAAVR